MSAIDIGVAAALQKRRTQMSTMNVLAPQHSLQAGLADDR